MGATRGQRDLSRLPLKTQDGTVRVVVETPAGSHSKYDYDPELMRAVGCVTCSKTGYRGRIALHEVMRVTEEIERHAVAHSSSADIMSTAVAQGMIPLRDDGWHKVALGQTSIEEILRVVVT